MPSVRVSSGINTGAKSFRVVFSSSTLCPATIPHFPYIPTAILRDRIEFTARITGEDVLEALGTLDLMWEGATPEYVVEDDSPINTEPHAMLVYAMGMMPPPAPPSSLTRWQRIKAWWRG